MKFEYVHKSDGIDGLSDAWLKARLPSVFATHPVKGVSDKYGFLPTTTILAAMRKEGFVPTEARHYMRRNSDALEFTKHMIRFRAGGKPKLVNGEVIPQIVLINSHDRSARAQLYGGLFRVICSNGLIVCESAVIKPVVIRHLSNPVNALLENVEVIIKEHASVDQHVREMVRLKLDEKQKLAFARAAADLRHPSRKSVFNPEDLLRPRREADKKDDLWHVFNCVQENFMKGGLMTLTAAGRIQQTTAIQSMKADMRINTGLWELAMSTIAKARGSAARAAKTVNAK